MLLVNNETPENYKSRYEEYQKLTKLEKLLLIICIMRLK